MHINNKEVKPVFVDKSGRVREMHNTRHGWRIKQGVNTIPRMLQRGVTHLMGPKIRETRRAVGIGPTELAQTMGYKFQDCKQRIYEIEKGRCGNGDHGIKLGTLYAIAAALGVEVGVLLPSVKEVMAESGVVLKPMSVERLAPVSESKEHDTEHRLEIVEMTK